MSRAIAIPAQDALKEAGFSSELICVPPSDEDPSVGNVRVLAHRDAALGSRKGRPLLLLHGHPQSSIIWRRMARPLANDGWDVIAVDLRGHGGSDSPLVRDRHAEAGHNELGPPHQSRWRYSKRMMARDAVHVMQHYGYDSFHVVGHDRGGRVAHRLALDNPNKVLKLIVLDIAPTTNLKFATYYWHWFFLIQPWPVPEEMLSRSPETYVNKMVSRLSTASQEVVHPPEVFAAYIEALRDFDKAHATAEDYRASGPGGVDLELDAQDRSADRRLQVPLRVLWGKKGVIEALFDPLKLWQAVTNPQITVTGKALDAGHYLPEEVPEELLDDISSFFGQS
ncbi:alpha beta hydrolase [Ceraceosorus bombacis]|uniref:Alpha beta hydrolase n=1 Tax=Ceraceosorus bombacis TaxID=401625 RepID=A0A0P1BPB5_9BASI|nr:alpha beta hydrolase [Ceraceosorus bombacis]